jgi:carbonic anhydrase
MQKLVQGIHDFQQNVFRSHQALFERLATRQEPDTLLITCSDSRVVPSLITQTDPGDLFIIRNAGNLVPTWSVGAGGGEAATIEYAVEVIGVRDVIVCGHSHCGAMTALLDPASVAHLPTLSGFLGHAEATRRIMLERYQHLSGQALLTATVEENVLVQLEHLRTHPSVAARLASGRLALHGWVYKLATGEVFAYDPSSGQYAPLATQGGAGVSADTHRRRLDGPALASPAADGDGAGTSRLDPARKG